MVQSLTNVLGENATATGSTITKIVHLTLVNVNAVRQFAVTTQGQVK